nr:glycosyltransferase [uncultured Albidiferax sp.]
MAKLPWIVVVVPVYRDVELTHACIASAMPAIMRIPGTRLVAINDASPDFEMNAMLDHEVGMWSGNLVVLKNETNLGFVKTANRGIRYDANADIVLLNSDVILPDRWLDRLIEDLQALSDAGTLTPLSNNTTISAFPNFMKENASPLALNLERIDEAFRTWHLNAVEAPTGVGFCLYIRRLCLQDVGELDEISFGTGYGEENDFCQRALRKGWKNYITPNLYVHHRGGVSFGTQREERIRNADRVLDRRYPSYHVDVQAFVVRDDLREPRLQRYFDLLRICNLPVVLYVSHGLGGGVDQHIRDLAQHSEGRVTSLLLQPEEGGRMFSIGAWNADFSMRILLDMQNGLELVLPLLKAIGVDLVHFHHLLGLPLTFLSLGALLDARQIFTCHDFYLVNSNPTLTNERGVFIPETLDRAANPLYPLPKGVSEDEWRQRYHAFLNTCAFVIFPSYSTYAIFRIFFKIKSYILAYHLEKSEVHGKLPNLFSKRSVYTIGVLGALSQEKGADLLEAMAVLASRRKLKLQFTLIGYAYRPLKQVKTTGPYEEKQLNQLIEHEKCDLILFPALWPETYSYTLSSALSTGLPIVAPNIGAFAERLAGRSNTLVFQHPTSTETLLQHIGTLLFELEAGKEARAQAIEIEKPSLDYYDYQYYVDIGIARGSKDRPEIQRHLNFLLSMQAKTRKGGRERLLRALWPIYSNPKLQSIFNFIPHRLKRSFKRVLSNKPLHELMRDD